MLFLLQTHMAKTAAPNAIAPAVRAIAPLIETADPATGALSVDVSVISLRPTQ